MYGRRMIFCAMCLVATLAVAAGIAFAHGQEHHTTEHTSDAQMRKLHAMMQQCGAAQTRIEGAFAKGDCTAAEKEIAGMIKAIPDLKKTRPHKGLNHLEALKKLAVDFDADLRQSLTLAKQGDLNGARQAFSRSREKCAACHALFRD
jgi:cytochrome c556